MTWTSTLALCAASSGAVAVPLLFHLNAVKRRLATAEQKLARIHNQHVNAGKQSHRAIKALQAQKLEELRQTNARRINDPLDDTGRGVAPVSTSARADFGSSAPLSHEMEGV